MIRTQIQLTEPQAKALRNLAAAEGRSMAELIRRSVDAFLISSAGGGREDKKKRALAAIGRFRSGATDLAEEHDRHLDEAFGQ